MVGLLDLIPVAADSFAGLSFSLSGEEAAEK